MEKKNNIILIGIMGCGKTSMGIRLSYRLRSTFLDTDRQIEKEQQCTISEIFAAKGEAAFRMLETEQLQELLSTAEGQIISTGGGLPVREENRKLLKQLGTVIWLTVTPETVYERLKEDITRPLLQGENPLEKIKELTEKRTEYYRDAADVIVDTEGKSQDEITEEIAALWMKRKGTEE